MGGWSEWRSGCPKCGEARGSFQQGEEAPEFLDLGAALDTEQNGSNLAGISERVLSCCRAGKRVKLLFFHSTR